MICFGVVNAICSVIFGSLMKYIGRFSIIVFGTVVHMGIFSYLLFWRPHPDSPLIFFLISGLWGVGKNKEIFFNLAWLLETQFPGDAVWQTQINGLYGTLFRRNKEAAFSNYRLWESLGFVIAYAYSTALCARMKLYSVMSVLGFGAFCYIIVEIRQLRKVIRRLFHRLGSFWLCFSSRNAARKNWKRSLMNHRHSHLEESTTKPTMRRMSSRKTS